MKLLLQAISWFALLFGGFSALVLWGFYLLVPAGLAAAMAATGFLVIGFFRFSDELDKHQAQKALARNTDCPAPVIRTEGRQAARLALSGQYLDEVDR